MCRCFNSILFTVWGCVLFPDALIMQCIFHRSNIFSLLFLCGVVVTSCVVLLRMISHTVDKLVHLFLIFFHWLFCHEAIASLGVSATLRVALRAASNFCSHSCACFLRYIVYIELQEDCSFTQFIPKVVSESSCCCSLLLFEFVKVGSCVERFYRSP